MMENPESVGTELLDDMEDFKDGGDMQLDIVPIEDPLAVDAATPIGMEREVPAKRRKKKSIVWEHFTIETVAPGVRKACCNQCKQSFAYSTGSKVAGTSHLKRHIAKGTCPVVHRNQEKYQITTYSAPPKIGVHTTVPKKRFRTPSVPFISFDADSSRHKIAKMIITHDYPLHIVEHPGFVEFTQSLQPRFDMVSFNTVQGDCVATYLREKQSIQKVMEAVPGRICLTLDLWSSSQTNGYMFVTGQFIDSEWNLHRKLLNVIMEPHPESDTAFSHSVAACLSDWNMDGKLFSVTINQSLADAAIDNLRALLSVKNPMILGGQLLVGNCLARFVSSMVEESLASVQGIVKKVRDSVKYVKTSESREEKFIELKQQLQVPSSKNLAVDNSAHWNTTYEMLLAASELKQVFSCLDTRDPDYNNALEEEEWKQVETLANAFLTPLFNMVNILASSHVPTTETFFHEVWKFRLEVGRASGSEDPFKSNLAKFMQEKFDKYFKSCCFILAIAVVMDPRFKMKLVQFSFLKIYGQEECGSYVKVVDDGIHELFLEYVALPLPLTPAYTEEANGAASSISAEDPTGRNNNGGFQDFDVYIMETTSQQSRSELEQYLEESLEPRVPNFDVIGWWELNKTKYPTLSKMARDILSIPVCSVPPESVFDTVRKEMDSYRCSLRPETVEALVCAKDWLLNAEKKAESSVPPVVKMEAPI